MFPFMSFLNLNKVESVLLEHEMVVESAVVGSPHSVKGLIVKAFIILANGH